MASEPNLDDPLIYYLIGRVDKFKSGKVTHELVDELEMVLKGAYLVSRTEKLDGMPSTVSYMDEWITQQQGVSSSELYRMNYILDPLPKLEGETPMDEKMIEVRVPVTKEDMELIEANKSELLAVVTADIAAAITPENLALEMLQDIKGDQESEAAADLKKYGPTVPIYRDEMIKEAGEGNALADTRIAELEAIEDKPMPPAVQQRIRQMTNHEHIVAKRAQRMGITVEEYRLKFPPGGPVQNG